MQRHLKTTKKIKIPLLHLVGERPHKATTTVTFLELVNHSHLLAGALIWKLSDVYSSSYFVLLQSRIQRDISIFLFFFEVRSQFPYIYIPISEKYAQWSFKLKDTQARNFFFLWLAQYCSITCLTWNIIRHIIAAPSPQLICVILMICLSYTDPGRENVGARQNSIINIFMFLPAIWLPSQLF